MARKTIMPMLAILLAGCAPGTPLSVGWYQHMNGLTIEEAQTPGIDYVVRLRNESDPFYGDPDVKETRDALALGAVKQPCPDATIAGERVLELGKVPLGRERRQYTIEVKCNRATASEISSR